jgi:hypothetical protein
MKTSVKYFLASFALMLSLNVYGQNAEMADTMRSEGKIYVVVAIILIVLTGLILYLFLMDRKISRLEQLIREKKQTKRAGEAL